MAIREIIFRGKRVDNGAWETGSFVVIRGGLSDEQVFIADKMTGYHTPVIPETVGQCTGLTDKNGKKIFGGDIVTGRFLHSLLINAVVAFRNGSFGLLWDRAGAETFDAFPCLCNIEYEVIGNIHDNPELLEAK